MMSFAGTILGILLLIGGGAMLVRGASEIASSLGVSPLIIGLTIVGFGTSAPELLVNIIAASRGATDLAFGNVVGSNISNLTLVLGAAAVIAPFAIHGNIVRREVPLLLLATTIITVMALDGPMEGLPARIGRADSVILMLLFCIFVYITTLDFIQARQTDPLIAGLQHSRFVVAGPETRFRWWLIVAGLVLLFIGGEATVRNGIALAAQLGISTTVIGLFVTAVGTSMPELATSIIAAVRKEADLALGNVIGSNIFNSLIVLPVSALIRQIPVPWGGVADLAVSWLLAVLLIPIFFFGRGRLGRISGILLLSAYIAYAIVRIRADFG